MPNSTFETWCNAKGFGPNHPLRRHLQIFSDIGADLDVVFTLCCMLALMNAVHWEMVEGKRQLASRKRRWTKEFRGLCSSHPGGKLRLTEVAYRYTISVIRSAMNVLVARGQIDSTAVIEADEVIQQALESLAKIRGFPEDWNAAIDDIRPVASNLVAAVGFAKVTPELGDWVKQLVSLFYPSVFENKGTKRRDDAGTFFLLFLTEHLRKTAKDKKPHFREAFNLMKSLSPKGPQRPKHGRKSAEVRVGRLMRRWLEWEAAVRRFERMVRHAKAN